MATFLFSFLFLLLISAAMAVGAIVKNKPIKGSCGGLSALGMKDACEICGGDKKQARQDIDKNLFFDASKQA